MVTVVRLKNEKQSDNWDVGRMSWLRVWQWRQCLTKALCMREISAAGTLMLAEYYCTDADSRDWIWATALIWSIPFALTKAYCAIAADIDCIMLLIAAETNQRVNSGEKSSNWSMDSNEANVDAGSEWACKNCFMRVATKLERLRDDDETRVAVL